MKAPIGVAMGFAFISAIIMFVGFSTPDQEVAKMQSVPETSQAAALILSRSEILETGPWQSTSNQEGRALLERHLRFVSNDRQGSLEVTEKAEVIDDNERAQRARYDELVDAVNNGRAKKLDNLEDLHLSTLDIGPNVASVSLIGDERLLMECEIIGFRMPSMIGRCRWISNGKYFMIETDPRLLRHIVDDRESIEHSLLLVGGR